LAYCASGTRCSVVWALGHAGEMGIDEVLNRATEAGYQLEGLRPSLQVFVDRGF
ncbi:MAG: TIGR01244 family phosphatase, partial [Pseudomonadota bacterium]